MAKRRREVDWLGPIQQYGPGHRGATVTARISKGPPAPRRPSQTTEAFGGCSGGDGSSAFGGGGGGAFGGGGGAFGDSGDHRHDPFAPPPPPPPPQQQHGKGRRGGGWDSGASSTAAKATTGQTRTQPVWQKQWKWYPTTDGEFCLCTKWFWRTLATARRSTAGMSASEASAASAAWKQQLKDAGIVNGKQYGRWEQDATGRRRWVRGQPTKAR